MSGSSCELLLPLINLSSCANYLDVTLDFHNPTRETICLMQDFLRNTPTLTLVCTDTKYISAPEWALSVSAAVSSLDRLLLFAFGCAQSRNPARAMAIEDQLIGSEGELNATITPPLPQLFIAKSAVTLAQLKAIVSRYRIQTIYLDSCHLDSLMAPSHDRDTVAGMNEMKKDLLEFAPNVQCVISSDDTTWRWRCRTIFNY
ncbi:hypothetical protein FRC12_019483 [Ceratobasidium sp. 428]|nr:hypothetical protein FRC12_019483 [Ceratobasidium sp. 428]